MKINAIFIDIGGVLLTNGWDHVSRETASHHFELDWIDFDNRHHDFYDLYEIGKISLDHYLNHVIFWKKRDFTPQQFKNFMHAQSKPYPKMLELMKEIKNRTHLRISTVSNEGRDLSDYRIHTFNLSSFIDDFFVSCFVGFQKPDLRIYKMALDVIQLSPDEVFYIDDRKDLVEAAATLGIRGLVHTSFSTTRETLLSVI